jgi:hypothetical protein
MTAEAEEKAHAQKNAADAKVKKEQAAAEKKAQAELAKQEAAAAKVAEKAAAETAAANAKAKKEQAAAEKKAQAELAKQEAAAAKAAEKEAALTAAADAKAKKEQAAAEKKAQAELAKQEAAAKAAAEKEAAILAAAEKAAADKAAAEKEAAERAAKEPGKFASLDLQVTASQHALIFHFQGNAPRLSMDRDDDHPEIVKLSLKGLKLGTQKKSWTFPDGSRFRKADFKGKGEEWVCRITLDSPVPLQASLMGAEILLTAPGIPDGSTWNWSSDAPSQPIATHSRKELSAHSDGEKWDAGKAPALRFEKVFGIGEVGASLILWKDSTSIRTAPGGAIIAKLPPGEKVNWLGEEGNWYQVLLGSDTAYVPKSHATFAGQLSAAQSKSLEKRQLAIQQQQEKLRAKSIARAAVEAATPPVPPGPPSVTESPASVAAAPPQPPESSPAPAFTQSGSAPETPEPPSVAVAEPGVEATVEVSESALAEERAAMEAEKERLAPTSERISYNSFGRRDPFIPVSQGTTENGIEIDKMKVVGIVWHAGDPIAVLEHIQESNLSFTVRHGDPVHNGKVSRITRDAITFDLTEYGITRAFTMKLVNPQERANK